VELRELREGNENSVAVPSSGVPYVFYHGPPDGDGTPDLTLLRCDDEDCASSTVSHLEVAGNTGLDPTALVDADDLPVVSYHQASFNGEAKIRRCNDAACGDTTARFFENSGDGRRNSLALDGSGNPVVAYVDKTAGAIDLARCEDAACTSFVHSTPVADVSAGRVALQLATGGLPVIAYHDRDLTALRYARCASEDCDGATIVTIDGGPGVDAGDFLAMALDAEGVPLFAYHDSTRGVLRVARCSSASCTGSIAFHTLDGDADSDVGTHLSMAVPPDGRPIIAYYDATLGDLKVAKCTDSSCSDAAIRRVAGDGGDVGKFTSIALGPDDLPVLVFQNVDTGVLQLARCRNPSCGA
jgi:hypothetical protein